MKEDSDRNKVNKYHKLNERINKEIIARLWDFEIKSLIEYGSKKWWWKICINEKK